MTGQKNIGFEDEKIGSKKWAAYPDLLAGNHIVDICDIMTTNYGNMKKIAITLLLLGAVFCNAGGLNKAKAFGIAGLAFSFLAISSDIGAEYNYDKYEEARLPDDCVGYRNRTRICEVVRDISFGLAVTNFSISTVLLLREKKQSVGFNINLKKGKLCAGFVKLLQ